MDFNSRRCFWAGRVGQYKKRDRDDLGVPRARSSEISKSLSLADMERYSAVTDIRLDWRSDRVSCDDIVFCRATG